MKVKRKWATTSFNFTNSILNGNVSARRRFTDTTWLNNSVVNTGTKIGKHCIINTLAASLDHRQ